MKTNQLFAAGLSIALALGAGAAWPTPISASMNISPFLGINQSTVQGFDSDAWGVPLSPLNISSSVGLIVGGQSGTVGGAGQATWGAGGNSGLVVFTNYGWSVNSLGVPTNVTINDHTNGNDWSYTFQADASGVFSMAFAVAGAGDLFGLQGWDILWSGPGGNLSLTNAFDPAAVGVFNRNIVAGQLYTVELRNNANLHGDGGLLATGHMSGTFAWTIAVPEPGTLALFAAALCLGALALRLRAAAPR